MIKKSEEKVVLATGKRKSAAARAAVKKGKGIIRINGILLESWTPEVARLKMMEPLDIVGEDKISGINIDVNVSGGGFMGQADSVRVAIANGLCDFFEDEEIKNKIKSIDRTMLVNDVRRKEAKKPLGRGARVKRQKSYR